MVRGVAYDWQFFPSRITLTVRFEFHPLRNQRECAMSLRLRMSIVVLFLIVVPVRAGSVKLKKIKQHIEVTIDGKLFTRYRIGGQNPKPYFWPIQAADGTVMSRPIECKGKSEAKRS